ncbi:hypothetical protein FB45DRAFT_916687 [Roridomyces roridus]|uniref:F-box domain-containing protein n=1 Tax=Roridomyces roridus TaxID=1738132 RepID=A0AAD7BU54_9AGAR|nr:hypothetical protein FB45DRAFT_916687 [Roridomyces roridus]
MPVPDELWAIIFHQALPHEPTPGLVEAPLNVSQVCRRFRSIALDSSLLWSTVAVHAGHAALQALLQLWLRRAGTRPLSISLSQPESSPSTYHGSSRGHLRSLEVFAPENCLFPLEAPELSFPVLEHLKIQSPRPRLAVPGVGVPLHRAPQLQSLAVVDAFFDASVFSLNQLTELTLLPATRAPPHVFWTIDETLDFVAGTPRLEALRLVVDDFMPRRRTLASAPSLLLLSIEFRDALYGASGRPARIGAFFSLLYTPKLQHLALRDRGVAHAVLWPHTQYLDIWPQAQFLSFLSATPLRVLHLQKLPLFETQVIECLQQVPELRDLLIEAPAPRGSQRNVGDTLLNALASQSVPPHGIPIASALRSVEFRHCGKRCTEQALISMIDSRLGALKYLRLHRSAIPSKELATRLAKSNMVVDVRY